MKAFRVALALLLFTGGFAVAELVSGRMGARADEIAPQPQVQAPRPAATRVTPPAPIAAGATLPDFSSVAARTVPAVANISSTQIVRRPNSPFGNDPFFRYFFGDDGDLYGSSRGSQTSLGSGVIISPDGYILTNNHVVTGDQRRVSIQSLDIAVSLGDKRASKAMIVGVDPTTDLALVKIDAHDLPTMPWGDSSKLKVAQWVLAIGNPYQLSQTVTLGIISALGRNNIGLAQYEDFIQTDAAINPGNSGGALVDAEGELVGINTAIFTQSGGYQGIGFAVPSNLARRIANDLQRYGEVRRGTIGYVEVAPLTGDLARQLGLTRTEGVLVEAMSRSSSAYRGGLQPGDVIVAFNGTRVDDSSQLSRLIQDARIGSTATVTVERQGRRMDLKIPIVRVTSNAGGQ
jgi:Do/DeqQ family serine protease